MELSEKGGRSLYTYTIIGAGIVGLSVAKALSEQFPYAKIIILEKEADIALHQTGRNSGVIHSGIYYQPGSLKASLARKGNQEMRKFCEQHDIEHQVSGKVIVATNEEELPLLNNLYERGIENELEVERISQDELKEIEPHVNGIEAIRVPSTGIVDYKQVAEVFKDIVLDHGGEIRFGSEVKGLHQTDEGVTVSTSTGDIETKHLINCAGLQSDRLAKIGNAETNLQIVPFRGEYYEVKPEKTHLVKSLVYPVPNPDFPFLGVHFTRTIDGRVLLGPNAVLSFKREGYSKTAFELKDFLETMGYPGFWKLAKNNMGEGLKEMMRSVNKALFIKEVQRFYPDIQKEDIVPAKAGVRAQAMDHDGNLIDDFKIIPDQNIVHICNAPSPAATASLEIGNTIVDYIKKQMEETA